MFSQESSFGFDTLIFLFLLILRGFEGVEPPGVGPDPVSPGSAEHRDDPHQIGGISLSSAAFQWRYTKKVFVEARHLEIMAFLLNVLVRYPFL